ncbi:MAG: hypothetical protein ACYSXF_07655 [Planctomycetota bacterium]|jgi:hypothetical protein
MMSNRELAALFLVGFPLFGLSVGPQCANPCVEPINEECTEDFVPHVVDVLPFTHDGNFGCTHNMLNWPYFDVYFEFTPSETGIYDIDMCGSMGDTALHIYTECSFDTALDLSGNDDGPCPDDPQADPSVSVELEAGTTYLIEVGARRTEPFFGSGPNCPFTLNISSASCDGDCGDPDGTVSTADLLALLAQWGGPGSCDIDGSGTVSTADLLVLLGNWGPC